MHLVTNDMSLLDSKVMSIFWQFIIDVGATYGKVDVKDLLPARITISKQLHQVSAGERNNTVKFPKGKFVEQPWQLIFGPTFKKYFIMQYFLSCTLLWMEDC